MSSLYQRAKQEFLLGEIDLEQMVVSIHLLSGYEFQATHETVADISAFIVATEVLSGKQVLNGGIFKSSDVTFDSVAAGSLVNAYAVSVVKQDSTERLVGFFDDATALPFQTDGGDVHIQFSTGQDRIFAI